VKYVQKSPETFDRDLLEALASGAGPDMFFLPDNLVFQYTNKIFTIPYGSFPLTTFKNTFAGAGEVFLTSKGTYVISNIKIESELKEVEYPTYYFEVSYEQYQDVVDEKLRLRATLILWT